MSPRAKFVLQFFCFILLCSCQTTAQRVDKEFLITATSVGNVALGMSLQDAISVTKGKYKVVEFDNGFLASLEGEKLFYFGRKTQEDTVGFIEIYSPKFKTKDGLGVGTPIAEAIKNKNIRMGYDGLSDEEYLAPAELQVPNEYFFESLCLFYVSSGEDGLLGDYSLSDNEESTYSFKTNGKISRVLIYYWN